MLIQTVQKLTKCGNVFLPNAHYLFVSSFILCFSIFTEERLERLTKQISNLDFDSPVGYDLVETLEEKANSLPPVDGSLNTQNGAIEASQSSTSDSVSGSMTGDISQLELQNLDRESYSKKEPNGNVGPLDPEIEKLASWEEPVVNSSVNDNFTTKQSSDRRLPNAVLPLLRCQQCESPESSSR